MVLNLASRQMEYGSYEEAKDRLSPRMYPVQSVSGKEPFLYKYVERNPGTGSEEYKAKLNRPKMQHCAHAGSQG